MNELSGCNVLIPSAVCCVDVQEDRVEEALSYIDLAYSVALRLTGARREAQFVTEQAVYATLCERCNAGEEIALKRRVLSHVRRIYRAGFQQRALWKGQVLFGKAEGAKNA